MLSSAPGAAQVADRVSIQWDGPSSCPRPADLEAEVGRLGPEAGHLQATSIALRVRERAPSGFALRLTTQGSAGRGAREMELSDCAEVHQAAALLIATALAPTSGTSEAREEQLPSELPAPARRPWSLRLTALGDLQSLPGLTAGPALGFGFGPRSVRAWVDARYLAAATANRDALPVAIELLAGAVGSAYVWSRGAFAFGPAAEAEIGGLRARSLGARAAGRAAWGPWASLWVGALVDYEIRGRAALAVAALVGAPLIRPEFYVDELGDGAPSRVHKTAAFSARAHLSMTILLGQRR